jgi:hypothetical protein
MKGWTLIAFYLSKDIWSRWLETPGAVLSRLFVAVLLSGVLLLTQAAFLLGERSLEARVSRMGAQTILITEAIGSEASRPLPLGDVFAPLGVQADLLALRQLSVAAQDEAGTDCLVMAYGPESLPALAPLLALDRTTTVHLFSPQLPAGLPVRVNIGGSDHAAVTLPAPVWLQRFTSGRALILLPAARATEWLELGYFETVLLIAREPGAPALRRLATALRTLLFLEGRPTAQVQSPEALLDELDALRALQARAQRGVGVLAGVMVALVFGSIALLEYRQNRFVVALLRSFGAPGSLLLLRYVAEAVALAVLAFLLCRAGLIHSHQALFAFIGFEPGLLDRQTLDPYAWTTLWSEARWLLLGATVGVLPVALAMRQPVGKILQ